MSKNTNIPTITELVAPGNPKLKVRQRKRNQNANANSIDELNLRIDEIEDAIGQDNSGPIGRAFAIRAEKQDSKAARKLIKNKKLVK